MPQTKPDLDERFSLHPRDPEDVLRKLLKVPPTDAQSEDDADDNSEPTQP
ncbi:MAG: hypothetical protein ACLPQS_13980 [Acidimicrobiales bacterium]